MHPYIEYVNPHLGKLLEDIKMDKKYIRGEGCYLYDSEGKCYLDCIAAYGALPFGYNHPEIWECIQDFQRSYEPSFIQPSALNAAGELAKRLIQIAPEGLKYVTYTNSGTESVEAAIKLSRSATGRMGILTTINSFHGKTMGALSATGNPGYQKAFGAPIKGFECIEYGNAQVLEEELSARPDYYAAFILEPIQGEGGIVEPPVGYLRQVREICSRHGVLLVLDEIQTGLGRTGKLFACQHEQVIPDVLVIAKALGGGIIPVGACLSTAEVYNEEFANKHSSTFAGNSLACRIGIRVLDILTRDNDQMLKQISERGELLKSRLTALQKDYPQLIKSVRGRGLMMGIEFGIDRYTFPGSMLGPIAEQDMLTPIVSSYLLNNQQLRVAPTLNGNHVIRIEPPLIISEEQCHACVDKIESMLRVLSEGHTAKFVSFLIDVTANKEYKSVVHKEEQVIRPTEDSTEGRFAFLIHPLDLRNYYEFDDSLASFNDGELSRLTNRLGNLLEPFVLSATRVSSKSGKRAYGEFIAIPRTTRELIAMSKEEALAELRSGLELAKERGAKIVGLGAFTSVVSMGGLYIKDEGIPLTTGNSYTVVSAVDAVIDSLSKLKTSPETASAAVVGATGSIGKGVALLLAEQVSQLVLIGNPANERSSLRRLYSIAGDIYRYLVTILKDGKHLPGRTVGQRLCKYGSLPSVDAPVSEFAEFAKRVNGKDSPILVTTRINEGLSLSDIVVCATSSIDKLITPHNLKYGAIVCDISKPGNVSKEVEMLRPDVLVIDGGVIGVPGRPSLGWNFGFEKGLAYACMAETMMLALEHHYQHTSIGSSGITLESILFTRQLANKHGFELADLRSFDRPLSPEKWQLVMDYRTQKTG